jgi:hypothetical protein
LGGGRLSCLPGDGAGIKAKPHGFCVIEPEPLSELQEPRTVEGNSVLGVDELSQVRAEHLVLYIDGHPAIRGITTRQLDPRVCTERSHPSCLRRIRGTHPGAAIVINHPQPCQKSMVSRGVSAKDDNFARLD